VDYALEVKNLSTLTHPNIVKFYGCYLKYPHMGILMEYCENGSLRDRLIKRYCDKEKLIQIKSMSMEQRYKILSDICTGMYYLHEENIMHRDLNPHNIFLNKKDKIKIGDFGISRKSFGLDSKKTSKRGTSYYMAPEVRNGTEYDNKCDVFSFSMIFYEVYTGRLHPFGNKKIRNLANKIANDPKFRPKLDGVIDDRWAQNLLGLCWNSEAIIRPNFGTILLQINDGIKNPVCDTYNKLMKNFKGNDNDKEVGEGKDGVVADETKPTIEEEPQEDDLEFDKEILTDLSTLSVGIATGDELYSSGDEDESKKLLEKKYGEEDEEKKRKKRNDKGSKFKSKGRRKTLNVKKTLSQDDGSEEDKKRRNFMMSFSKTLKGAFSRKKDDTEVIETTGFKVLKNPTKTLKDKIKSTTKFEKRVIFFRPNDQSQIVQEAIVNQLKDVNIVNLKLMDLGSVISNIKSGNILIYPIGRNSNMKKETKVVKKIYDGAKIKKTNNEMIIIYTQDINMNDFDDILYSKALFKPKATDTGNITFSKNKLISGFEQRNRFLSIWTSLNDKHVEFFNQLKRDLSDEQKKDSKVQKDKK
jgi:serine/threonine protein kinase